MALRPDRPASTSSTSRPAARRSLGSFPGVVLAPRFSPDGSTAWPSRVERGGNTDVYVMDLRTRASHAADHRPGHRHLAVLLARRHQDRLQLRPRRPAAALHDERRRLGRAAHLLRRRALHHPWSGARAATSSPSPNRPAAPFHIGVMTPGRLGRAHPDHQLSRRGPDLGAQRPRA